MALTVKMARNKLTKAKKFLAKCESELIEARARQEPATEEIRKRLADPKCPKWMDAECLANQP